MVDYRFPFFFSYSLFFSGKSTYLILSRLSTSTPRNTQLVQRILSLVFVFVVSMCFRVRQIMLVLAALDTV